MESLEEKEVETAVVAEESSNINTRILELSKRFKPTIPFDLISGIFSRLPVKSLIKFESISKMWCSIIQSRLFATAYLTQTLSSPLNRCFLLIVVRDNTNSQCHFLSGSYFGGSTTHLLTLPNIPTQDIAVDHVNSLVLFRTQNGWVKHNFAYIINPSTHEVFKLPGNSAQPKFSHGNAHICYFLGFDPNTDQFKVLNIRIIELGTPENLNIECGIFSLSTCTWKRIDPVFPFDLTGEDWTGEWPVEGVCINGVMYMILCQSRVVAAFDLREEKFSLIPLPQGLVISNSLTSGLEGDQLVYYINEPYLINYNGLLAVICYENISIENLVEVWILKDCDTQFWIKEIINLPGEWKGTRKHLPGAGTCTGELMFSSYEVSGGCMTIPFYEAKTRSFRFADVTLSPEWLASDDIRVSCNGVYVESILHLKRNN